MFWFVIKTDSTLSSISKCPFFSLQQPSIRRPSKFLKGQVWVAAWGEDQSVSSPSPGVWKTYRQGRTEPDGPSWLVDPQEWLSVCDEQRDGIFSGSRKAIRQNWTISIKKCWGLNKTVLKFWLKFSQKKLLPLSDISVIVNNPKRQLLVKCIYIHRNVPLYIFG